MFDSLIKYFEIVARNLQSVSNDIVLLQGKLESSDKLSDKRIISSTTVEPFSRLRDKKEDLEYAQENPEFQFVIDRINDSFS